MNITLPLLMDEVRRPGGGPPVFMARPLFFDAPVTKHEQLSRALSKLAGDLRKQFDAWGKQTRHDQLVRWTFNPMIEEHQLKTRLLLSRGTVDCRVLVVSFEALGRRLAMVPPLHDRWFEVNRGQKVLERAEEILRDHFNQQLKEVEDFEVPREYTADHRRWVTTLELDVTIDPDPKELTTDNLLAMLGGAMKMSGRAELQNVGRCLDWLYPSELDRAVFRDAEVAELEKLLAARDRQPILVLGEPQAGKTAVIHECVHRRVAKARSPHVSKRNVWLLSPQRLISGMMYVGQWENRVTAILDEAIKRDHVLYFDDVLGLYYAGLAADSDLTVAHVLKPYVERRQFRMLAEMTPAAFRALQERDRGFADLFHVLPVRPTSLDLTRRILFEVRRQLEGQHQCRFNLEVLPLVLDLGNRYLRESAQPGKSAQFYRQLAGKYARQEIGRSEVLGELRGRSGLSLDFLDDRSRLRREEVIEALSHGITGQEEAVAAMADAVVIAKARLNDPGRPLATFLFLGPTGVGKTHCAKALAAYLFGDEKRLLRFDMNEYLDGAAAARLNGTAWEPEGLLTAAVRRQPFSVVLLDEIEKAHPAVFDLLLQVLGEGRLTDALGRTADFGNTIIIMTSNLGVRQAGAKFGLRPAGESDRQTYITAAERFFRPEFFNRIDRIVPFERLTRPQIGRIAERLIGDVLRRDGLAHRRSILAVDPAALEKVVDDGYHPQLGARALKRSIERQLTGPVATHLAGAAPDAPAVIHLYPAASGIAVRVDTLVNAPRRPLIPAAIDLHDWANVLDQAEAAIYRIESAAAPSDAKALTQGALSAAQFRYLAIREFAEHIRRFIGKLDRTGSAPKKSISVRPGMRGARSARKMLALKDGDARVPLRAAAEIAAEMAAMESEPQTFGDVLEDQLSELIHEVALLQAMAAGDGAADRCLVWLRTVNPSAADEFKSLLAAYRGLFASGYGFVATDAGLASGPRESALILEMPGIATVMAGEQGTHFFTGKDHNVIVVQAIVVPLAATDASETLRQLQAADGAWRASMRQGTPADDPFPLRPVVRTYDPAHLTVDLRSGLAVRGLPAAEEVRRFVLSQLPASEEFVTATEGR